MALEIWYGDAKVTDLTDDSLSQNEISSTGQAIGLERLESF